MGLLSRQKGKTFERWLAKTFRAIFPTARRTLTQQRDSGEAPDISIPGWWVEAKHWRKVNIRQCFEQAVDEAKRAKSTDLPIAVTKDNRKEPLATLRLQDFLWLLQRVKLLEEQIAEPSEHGSAMVLVQRQAEPPLAAETDPTLLVNILKPK